MVGQNIRGKSAYRGAWAFCSELVVVRNTNSYRGGGCTSVLFFISDKTYESPFLFFMENKSRGNAVFILYGEQKSWEHGFYSLWRTKRRLIPWGGLGRLRTRRRQVGGKSDVSRSQLPNWGLPTRWQHINEALGHRTALRAVVPAGKLGPTFLRRIFSPLYRGGDGLLSSNQSSSPQSTRHTLSWNDRPVEVWRMPWFIMAKQRMWPLGAVA